MRDHLQAISRGALMSVAVLACCLSPGTGQPSSSASGRPRSGQADDQPVLFMENNVSTGFDERSVAFAPDGKSIYLTKGIRYADLSVIVVMHLKNGTWRTPEVVAFSGRYRDRDPFVSANGTRLYFSSDRPVPGAQSGDFNLWVVEKKARGWGLPKNLGLPINTDSNEQSPCVTSDGTLYFTSDRKGGRGDLDIYRARLNGKEYSPPENLGEAINSAAAEMEVSCDPLGQFLVFSSRRPGFGNSDLLISHLENDQWAPAKNLGSGINNAAEECSPSLSPDGQSLFFSSTRGLGQRQQQRRLTYQELLIKLRSAGNDSADIYRVSMRQVLSRR